MGHVIWRCGPFVLDGTAPAVLDLNTRASRPRSGFPRLAVEEAQKRRPERASEGQIL